MSSGLSIEVRGPFPGRRRHRWRVFLVGGDEHRELSSIVARCWTRLGAEAVADRTRADLSNMPDFPPVVSRVAVEPPVPDPDNTKEDGGA